MFVYTFTITYKIYFTILYKQIDFLFTYLFRLIHLIINYFIESDDVKSKIKVASEMLEENYNSWEKFEHKLFEDWLLKLNKESEYINLILEFIENLNIFKKVFGYFILCIFIFYHFILFIKNVNIKIIKPSNELWSQRIAFFKVATPGVDYLRRVYFSYIFRSLFFKFAILNSIYLIYFYINLNFLYKYILFILLLNIF